MSNIGQPERATQKRVITGQAAGRNRTTSREGTHANEFSILHFPFSII